MVNLRLSIVKIRFCYRVGLSSPGSGAVSKNAVLLGGTEGSNPSPSSGESVSRGTLSSGVKNPGFPRGFRGCVLGAVGRELQGPPTSRRPAAISLSGHIPVPHFWRCGRDKLSG